MNFGDLAAELGLEEDEYRELIELFLSTGPADLSVIRTALNAGDLTQVMRRAHTIKGAAGNLGLAALHEAARHIESTAAQGRSAGLAEAVDTLGTQFDVLQKAAER